MSGPTIYRTLMVEAVREARNPDHALALYGLDTVVADNVAPAAHNIVAGAISNALAYAYRRGVEHGYQQAAEAFDEKAAE